VIDDVIHVLLIAAFLAAAAALSSSAVRCCSGITIKQHQGPNMTQTPIPNPKENKKHNLLDDDLLQLL
jgi:hypothetical protein